MNALVSAFVLASAAALGVPPATAAVYRCVDRDKKVTYQAQPCKSSSGTRIEMPVAPAAGTESKAADDLEQLRANVASQEQARIASDNAAEIARLDAEIRANNTKRDKELATLQARLDYVTLNMAGAQWERVSAQNAIRATIQSVSEQYNAKNQPLRDRIAQLQRAQPPATP
jgi:hypothetical protein